MDLATFRLVTVPRGAVLTVTGELDLGSLPQLTTTLSLVEASDVDPLRIDVGGVTFVACCCLRALDDSRRRLESRGRSIQLVAASPIFLAVAGWAQYTDLTTLASPGAATRTTTSAARRHDWRTRARRVPVRVACVLAGRSHEVR